MKKVKSEDQTKAYSQAVASGTYERDKGLRKKYDNVRLYWEDEITRQFIRPFISNLVKDRVANHKKLRILDLGCGSGDGFELLMEMVDEQPDQTGFFPNVIPATELESYIGIDFNKDLLAQNNKRWEKNTKMKFLWGDLSKGLPCAEDEDGFDIYFTSFGTFSHFTDDQTTQLISDIAQHARDKSIIICDWLGRYSYEWQTLWDTDLSREKWMDYLISYIYPPEIRKQKEISILALHLLAKDEIMRMVEHSVKATGINIDIKGIFDRSLFIGRHMDTCDYNPHLKPLRQYVNSLFEKNMQTDLDRLLMEYHPGNTDEQLNDFFKSFSYCWNTIVRVADQKLKNQKYQPEIDGSILPGSFQKVLGEEIKNLDAVFNAVKQLQSDNLRANIIEPQLAIILKNLEYRLQDGRGTGHGLIMVLEINK